MRQLSIQCTPTCRHLGGGQRWAFSTAPLLLRAHGSSSDGGGSTQNSKQSTSDEKHFLPNDETQAQSLGGLGGALRQFLRETFSYSSHSASSAGKDFKTQLIDYANFVNGTDKSPEELERERKKQSAYNEVRNQQYAAKKAEEHEKTKDMSTVEWLKYKAASVMESAKAVTSKQQGVMALVQHCTAAHAAEVAVEQGIDVKSVNIVLEEVKASARSNGASEQQQTALGEGPRVVGYIDAPGATEEEVMQFAERLTNACPAANTMRNHIEWRKVDSSYAADPADLRGRNVAPDLEGSATSEATRDVGVDSGYAAKGSGFSVAGGHHRSPQRNGSLSGGYTHGVGSTFSNPFEGLNIPKSSPSQTDASKDDGGRKK